MSTFLHSSFQEDLLPLRHLRMSNLLAPTAWSNMSEAVQQLLSNVRSMNDESLRIKCAELRMDTTGSKALLMCRILVYDHHISKIRSNVLELMPTLDPQNDPHGFALRMKTLDLLIEQSHISTAMMTICHEHVELLKAVKAEAHAKGVSKKELRQLGKHYRLEIRDILNLFGGM
jgi:hypothetical protein